METVATSNDSGSMDAADLGCPSYSMEAEQQVEVFSFWVEGISQTTVAILGIVGNSLASVILTRKEMRNAFNLLLVSMACFDSTYLFGSILESFRKQFNMASDLHIILFPYLLYPFNQIAFMASIFMTIAIGLERFIAVHYPLNYSQAMHEANALTKRIVKYVASVTFLSIVFTGTRFFEAKVEYDYVLDPATNETVNYTVIGPLPTDLRTHPIYTAYFNWSRLVVLGIIPFVLLVYLNTKIYQDIKARRNRRMSQRDGSRGFISRGRGGARNCCASCLQVFGRRRKGSTESGGDECGGEGRMQGKNGVVRGTNGKSGDDEVATEAAALTETQADTSAESKAAAEEAPSNGAGKADVVVMTARGSANNGGTSTKVRLSTPPQPPAGAGGAGGAGVTNESRRKKEDNLAAVFMGFIIVFLVCHLPRLLLNIHELATIRHAMECQANGFQGFPLWSGIMISISHLLLAINSATNILIYCCLSSQFRLECKKVFGKL